MWEKRSLANVQISYRSYLLRSAYNSSLRYLANKNAEKKMLEAYLILQDNIFYPHAIQEKEEQLAYVLSQIRALPKKARKVFIEVHIEGKKRKEVAVQLGISRNTVNTHLHFGQKKLRAYLSKQRRK